MNFLTIGQSIYDINILLDNYLAEGSFIDAKEIVTCCGGSACVTSLALAKWNVDSYISTVLGNDENATHMRNMLNDTRIKTNYLEIDYENKTSVAYILHSNQNNSVSTVNALQKELHIKRHEYDLPMDCIITDGTDVNATMYALNKYANATTILSAYTPDRKLLDIFKYVKTAIISDEIAEAMTGFKIDMNNPVTLANIYKKIVEKYTSLNLIIKVKGKGTVYNLNGEIKFISGFQEPVVDDRGSYEIYTAGYAYAIMNHLNAEESIRFASIVENFADKNVGATLSIPLLSDVITYYESKFGPLNLNKETPNNIEVASNNAPTA